MEAEGISGDGNLPEIEISMDDSSSYYNDEDRNLFPEEIPHSGIVYDDGTLYPRTRFIPSTQFIICVWMGRAWFEGKYVMEWPYHHCFCTCL